MTCQPRDKPQFLTALGEKMVRKMLINDEFTGATKVAADKWLANREVLISRRHRLYALAIGISVPIILAFVTQLHMIP